MPSRFSLASRAVAVVATICVLLTIFQVAASAVGASTLGTAVTKVDGVQGSDSVRSDNIKARVRATETIGNAVLVGGPFERVNDQSSGRKLAQPYLAAFDASTGDVLEGFRPGLNGAVLDIADLGNGRAVIAGEFTRVNNKPAAGIAVIHVADGRLDTSFTGGVTGRTAVVRAIVAAGGQIYAVGDFNRAIGAGQNLAVGGGARFALANGQPSSAWRPNFVQGTGWGIDISGGTVIVGGTFQSVNGQANTHGIVALSSSNGALLAGWNHGIEVSDISADAQELAELTPLINDVGIAGNRVFLTSKRHWISVMDLSTGNVVVNHTTSNGGQVIEVVGDRVYIGCHCAGTQEWIWELDHNGVRLGFVGQSMVGAAGPWALASAPDGCLWTGGDVGSGTNAAGGTVPVFDLARICPTNGPGAGATPIVGIPNPTDRTAPSAPAAPTSSQSGATIQLSWPAISTADGDVRYEIARNGVVVGATGGPAYRDRLVPVGIHTWQIRAVDLAGNAGPWSPRSAPVRIANPVNIAPQGTAGGTASAEGTIPSHAIDGSTATTFTTRAVDSHLRLDLGTVRPVDRIDVVLQNTPGWYFRYHHLLMSNGAFDGRPNFDAKALAFGTHTLPSDTPVSGVHTIEVAEELRGLRMQGPHDRGELVAVAATELRVWTTPTVARPASPAADTSAPTAPTWASRGTNGPSPTLRWGGAGDNNSVTAYEIIKDGSVLATTTDRVWVHNNPNLTPAQVAIVSIDAAGNRSTIFGNPGSAPPDTTRPSVPTGVTATAVPGAINLAWSASTDNVAVTGYHLYRSTNNGTFTQIATPTTTNHTDTNVTPGTTYRYYLKATDAAQNTSWRTGYKTATAIAGAGGVGGPVSAPASCSASNVGTAATINWTASAGATDYRVYRSVDGSNAFWRGLSTTSSFSDTLRASGTHSYSVQARGADRVWSTSTICNPAITADGGGGVPDTTRPSVPNGVTATAVAGAINLTWNPSTDNVAVTGYHLYRSTNNGTFTRIATPTTTNHTDTNVTPGTTYRYYLKATDAAQNTSWRTGYRTITAQ